MLDIDLLRYRDQLKTQKDRSGEVTIWDPIRRQWLVLQPEELVRQLFIQYCILALGFPATRMSVERHVKHAGVDGRYDLALHDREGQPSVLVECKAPEQPVHQAAFEQIARYNLELRAPWLIVTNGMESRGFHIDFDTRIPSEVDAIEWP